MVSLNEGNVIRVSIEIKELNTRVWLTRQQSTDVVKTILKQKTALVPSAKSRVLNGKKWEHQTHNIMSLSNELILILFSKKLSYVREGKGREAGSP